MLLAYRKRVNEKKPSSISQLSCGLCHCVTAKRPDKDQVFGVRCATGSGTKVDKSSNEKKKTTLMCFSNEHALTEKNKKIKLKITSFVVYSRETMRVKKWEVAHEKTWEEGFH